MANNEIGERLFLSHRTVGTHLYQLFPTGDGPDRSTPVATGLVVDGWIEITSGLKAGDAVRLPG